MNQVVSPSPTVAPEFAGGIYTRYGQRIGFVIVEGGMTQAWGFGPEGIALLLEAYRSNSTDTQTRAGDRVWRYYEAHHWMAPEDRGYRPGIAA